MLSNRLRSRLALPLLALLLASCRSTPGPPMAFEPGPSETIPATSQLPRSGVEVPATCTEEAVRSTVTAFLSAYSQGTPGLVERFFAPSGRFRWYSEIPERLDEAAADRSSLDQYLRQRHQTGDRLRLRDFTFTGYEATEEVANFGFDLLREGTVPGSIVVPGKGTIDCRSGKIMVWSLGRPRPLLEGIKPYARSCGTHVEGSLGEGWREEALMVGPLALLNLPTYGDEPPETFEAKDRGRYPSQKVLAVVEAGASVTLLVAEGERNYASLLYDPAAWKDVNLYAIWEGDPAVSFEACPNQETQFNGALLVAGPRCLPLDIIYVENDKTVTKRVMASLGAGACG